MSSKWGLSYAHKADAFAATNNWKKEAKYINNLLPPNGVFLDLACNTGRLFEYLGLHKRKNLTCIGVDINLSGLEIAKQRMPNLQFYQYLSEVPSSSVDVVVCTHALPQFENPAAMLAEVWRVLTRGGKIIFIMHNKYNDYVWFVPNLFTGYKHDETITTNFSLSSLNRLMKDSGFLVIDSHRYGGVYTKILPILRPRLFFYGEKPL